LDPWEQLMTHVSFQMSLVSRWSSSKLMVSDLATTVPTSSDALARFSSVMSARALHVLPIGAPLAIARCSVPAATSLLANASAVAAGFAPVVPTGPFCAAAAGALCGGASVWVGVADGVSDGRCDPD